MLYLCAKSSFVNKKYGWHDVFVFVLHFLFGASFFFQKQLLRIEI